MSVMVKVASGNPRVQRSKVVLIDVVLREDQNVAQEHVVSFNLFGSQFPCLKSGLSCLERTLGQGCSNTSLFTGFWEGEARLRQN